MKLYEGKAKQIYTTENPNVIRVHYKDDATAFNGIKKAQINNKGMLNNRISALIFTELEKREIKTHYLETLSPCDQLCKQVTIIPLEVIIRNIAAGSFASRFKIEEGEPLSQPVFEICYKSDELGDPLINDDHAFALGLCDEKQLADIRRLALQINRILIELFAQCDLRLVDFKIEFGIDETGTVILADEISPDSCRLWDMTTNRKLDKDRFRRDLGDVEDAYQEVLLRLEAAIHVSN